MKLYSYNQLRQHFSTVSEEMTYFYMVLTRKISKIVNSKDESCVNEYKVRRIVDDCSRCAFCLAHTTSAELICTKNAGLDPNCISCQEKPRKHTGTVGRYTTEVV